MSEFVFSPAPPVALPTSVNSLFPVHRVYCVGRNYLDHAIEMGQLERDDPFFFCKSSHNLVASHNDKANIPYPSQTQQLHHEVELVVALGAGGNNLSVQQAQDSIWGYAVGLDMTRRDLQNNMKKHGRPWEIGKAFDASAPMGLIYPKQEVPQLAQNQSSITLSVNGEIRQQGDIAQMIWSASESVAYLSKFFTLHPGDLLFTGTPAGVGAVVAGDVLVAKIDGLAPLTVVID